ncbi:MAG: citrate synthase [Pseudomonadota bacterium]|nr:MAG: citrate synthase [Pseudomonadota bacterium]
MDRSSDAIPYVPGLAGVPAAESKICDIDGQRGILFYRGYPIEELAEKSTYEETSYLLLFGELPTKEQLDSFTHDLVHHRRLKYKIIDLMKTLPETGHPMDALAAAVGALGMFYPHINVMDPQERYGACVRLVAKLPTIVAAYHRMRRGDRDVLPNDNLGHAANFLYMLNEKEPDPFHAKILDTCLVLHAEHSMNASTFSARVTGSALADSYAVVASAVGTLSGPLHGGANEAVLEMLEEIGSVENVVPWLDKAMAAKRKIPGFGHREYKVKDPRAKILQKLAEQLFARYGSTPLYDIAVKLEEEMARRVGDKGVYPNVDFYSGLVYQKLGIPSDLFTPIFAIARVSGWLAHWLEQLENNRIFRPSQVYVGPAPRSYVPIDRRG